MAGRASPGHAALPAPGGMRDGLLTILASVAGIALYTWHCAPTVRYWDAAERTLVAWQMGLSHPTGCVLHAAFGKVLMTLLPLAPEYSANLLSVLACGLALGVAYRLARRFSADRRLCLAATLVLGTSALYWSQAVYSEVYALHFLFVALFMLYYVRWLHHGTSRDLVVAAFVYALGLGVHMSHVLLAPWILIGVILKDRSIFRSPKTLLAVGGAGLLGLTWIVAVVIRGKTYWLTGTTERPDSLARLLDFLTGAQFAWARHPPAEVFAKRVAGSLALLLYSFLGVGVFVALAGWLRTLRRYSALAVLASGGTLTYVLYFSDNLSSDVGTLILPCCLFVFLYFVVGWERWASSGRRRNVAFGIVAILAAAQWIVFPVLSRAAEREARRFADTGTTIDRAGRLSSLFWEGVLKAGVTSRNDFEPYLHALILERTLEKYGPDAKALILPWEIKTVLSWYQASQGWFDKTRLYEPMDQRRFYRPETGSEAEIIEGWRDAVPKYAGKRPVLVLSREHRVDMDAPRRFIGSVWFDQQYYHLFEMSGPG